MKKIIFNLSVLAVFSVLFWQLPSALDQSESLRPLLSKTRDVLFRIRRATSDSPKSARDLVIISIDEESCEKLGVRWPWPRQTLAALVDQLTQAGVRLVALNLTFTGLENGEETSTGDLARAIRENGHVIVGMTFDRDNQLIRPSPEIAQAAAGLGYLEKIMEEDFFIRRSYLIRPYYLKKIPGSFQEASVPDRFESSFPLAVAALSAGRTLKDNVHFDGGRCLVTVADPHREITLSPDGSYLINYLAGESDLTFIPAWKLIQKKVTRAELQGKAAFVGLTSSLLSDRHPTPLGMLSGIVIHANEFLAIQENRMIRYVPDSLTLGLSWILSLCLLGLMMYRRFWLSALAWTVAVVGLFLLTEVNMAKDVLVEPFWALSGPVLAAAIGVVSNLLYLFLENRGLERKVWRDKLTHLYTYDYLRMRLSEEWKRCQKLKLPLSVVMVDLDRFKQLNDTLGHEEGNQMILRAAAVIRDSVRGYDVVARYGGDEFVVLLWHTGQAEALCYRERLRSLYLEMAKTLQEPLLKASSMSVGIATYDPAENALQAAGPQELIEQADRDLYSDKDSRRLPAEGRR